MARVVRQVIDKEMKKPKSHSEDESVHKHAPGWNEVLASVSEANVKVGHQFVFVFFFFFAFLLFLSFDSHSFLAGFPHRLLLIILCTQADQHDGQIDVEETIKMVRKQHHPDGAEEVSEDSATKHTSSRYASSLAPAQLPPSSIASF